MSSSRSACLSLAFFALLFISSPARGDDTVILNIIANYVDKGEYFVIMADDGDFFIRMEDLEEMGFRNLDGQTYEIEDELYMALRSIKRLQYNFNEKDLSLNIAAMPFHFKKEVIDFESVRPPGVRYPKDSSAFLNYSIEYMKQDAASHSTELTNQLGVRYQDLLFISDSIYKRKTGSDQFVRLMSSITHDRREDLEQVVIGDFFVSPGEFGSRLNMGGIRYSKTYLINPYFIENPLIDFSGAVSLPTEVQFYIDGIPLRKVKLSPGEFELRNLSPREGAGKLEMVLRDPFGREERLEYPFYFTTNLLRPGLHDYSYNAGYLRESFGVESSDYGDWALSGFHRYGFSDPFTAGFRVEIKKKRYNLGPAASIRVHYAGIITLALSNSRDDSGKKGTATLFSYLYQGRRLNGQLQSKWFSRDYAPLLGLPSSDRTRYEASAGIGYSTRVLGSFTAGYSQVEKYQGLDRRIITIGYTRNIISGLSLISSYRRIHEVSDTNEFLVGINYYPFRDTSISTRYQKIGSTDIETVQVHKNAPLGKGFGGRAFYQRANTDIETTHLLNTFFQYNAPYGIYTGEYQSADGDNRYQASAAGGIAYVGRRVGLSRPITDSFGLVEVGQLPDIRVYANNQEVGRTDPSGKVFIPNLSSYYDNQISINDRDVPIDYSIEEVLQYISPPGRSGSHIRFKVTKIQAVFGRIRIQEKDELRPVEYYEITMMIDGKEMTFPTGTDGEFYLENIPPGQYRASFIFMEKPCIFDIIIPMTEDMLMDLGELTCEKTR